MLETLVRVFKRVKASAPALVTERGIGDNVIKGLERFAILEIGISQVFPCMIRALGLLCRIMFMRARPACGCVFFLSVKGDLGPGFVGDLQKQRTRTAGGVIGSGVSCSIGLADADYLCYDPADLGRGIELAFALAAFRCEVAHQVFVSIAQDIVTFGPVLREIKGRVLKNGNEVGKPFNHFLTAAELVSVIKVRHIG